MPDTYLPALPPEAAAALLPVLLEGMGGGMALHDAELRRSFASRVMDEMLGLPPELAPPGTPLADQLAALEAAGALDPADSAGIAGAFAGPGRCETGWRTGDGRHLHLAVMDAPGGGRLALCRDVTAARQAELELAAGRARVEHLLSRTRDVVVLMEADGTILQNSDRTGELLLLPPELARPGSSHQAILRHMVARGDFGVVEDPEAFVEERRAGILRARTVTFSSRLQDDSWVEYNFRVMEDGKLLAFVRDITALKTTELALEKERAMLDTIISNLPDGVVLLDAEYRWRMANRRLLEFLALPEEVARPGAGIDDILRFQARRGDFGPPPQDPEGFEALVAERRQLMLHPEGSNYVRQTAGGFWIEFNMRPLPEGGLLTFYRDVTPLKQREAELEAERTLLREVLDGVDALVLLLDRDANILVANESHRDLMATPEEFYRPGTNLADAVRWRYREGVYGFETDEEEAVRSRIGNVYSGGVVRYDRRMPDGRSVETIWTPISGGRVVGFYRDITALKEREAELEAERTLLREVIDSSDALLSLIDDEGRVLLANGGHKDLMGLPRAFFEPGSTFAEGIRALAAVGFYGEVLDLEALVQQRMRRIYASEITRFDRRMPEGRWLEFSYRLVSRGRLIAQARDITALKQHEEELTTERAMLREVLDSSDSVIIVLDSEGRVLLANGRFEELIGVPAEMHEPGRPFSEIIRYLYRRGDFGYGQDEETTVRARIAAVFAGELGRYLRLLPNGRWIEFNFKRISGGRVISFARDLSALRSREAELDAERTLLREVLDSTDALVTLFDADARIILANERHSELLAAPQNLFAPGVTFREGIRWLVEHGHFGPVEDIDTEVEERQEMVLSSIRAGESQRYARQMPDGRWVEFTYSGLSGSRMISHARDVTPLKSNELAALAAQAEAEAARDAAEAAAQAKSAFLAAMSHEIRTPMNGVLGMLEILDRSELGVDQARSVAVMRESAHSLLRIIDDVLDFSKIEAGRMEVEALPFSLRGLIEGTVETLIPQARQRGLTLFADPQDPGPDWLEGDPTRIRQILFNLIGNALKFTERGFVRLAAQTRTEGEHAAVRLIVEDSGVGMDAPTLARLFQPFTQADSSTTRRFGGTGLGLSIVRRLVELMEGEVRAESTPGRGSRFIVTLRLAIASAPAVVRPAPSAAPANPNETPLGRVLVVDDHPVNREVITRQLELLGVSAATAEDGAQGLAHWRHHHPSVLLLDIHMPIMDGFELARAIRQEEQARGLPRTTLIAVTANALKGEAERCYAAGMDGFVAKPVTLDGLSRALGRFMPGLAQAGGSAGGALFDPDALRGLFGQDRERLLGILESFAEQAAHDIQRLLEASGPRLAEAAHRLKGSSRMVGARLLAEAAQAIEEAARADDVLGVEASRGQLEKLLADTLAVARPALGGVPADD